jgi:hypothetical protein
MFSFLTGSQNLELYLIIILAIISALPLDTIFINMWLFFFITALIVFIVGKPGLSRPGILQQLKGLYVRSRLQHLESKERS